MNSQELIWQLEQAAFRRFGPKGRAYPDVRVILPDGEKVEIEEVCLGERTEVLILLKEPRHGR